MSSGKTNPSRRTAHLWLLLLPAALLLLPSLLARADDGAEGAPTSAPASAPAGSAGKAKTPDGPAPTGTTSLTTRPAAGEGPRGAARFVGVLGYLVVLGLCFLLSNNRKRIRWRAVGWAVALQVVFAMIVLNPVVGQFFFDTVDAGVRGLLGFADQGIEFLFQSTSPHEVTYQSAPGVMSTKVFIGQMSPALKSVAFSVLPTVIFFSALIAVLYHLGLMQWVVRGVARAMVYALGTSGAETLSCTANIFVGQTEAPLVVKPFIEKMTKSELMAVMTGGFATVAGGVLAIYVGLLRDVQGIAGHLVTASIMAAPAALGVAKMLYPETEQPVTAGRVAVNVERLDSNAVEALARGATEGMTLFLNICAMLIAFVGLMALFNGILGVFGTSLQQLFGWAFSPLAWLIGVPWGEAKVVGGLLGEKIVLTELLAYLHLKGMIGQLSARTTVIASYGLCGFANVASIGIQIGGIGGMAPSRRGDIAKLAIRAMSPGAMVSLMSAAIAGILV